MSVALREIIRACYTHFGQDVSTYIQPDVEDPHDEPVPVSSDLQNDDGEPGNLQDTETGNRKRPNTQEFTPLAVRRPKRHKQQPQRLE